MNVINTNNEASGRLQKASTPAFVAARLVKCMENSAIIKLDEHKKSCLNSEYFPVLLDSGNLALNIISELKPRAGNTRATEDFC